MSRNMTERCACAELLFNGTGACIGRKSLRRKGRAFLRRDLCRHQLGWNGSTMLVRAKLLVAACPVLHVSRESPNV